MISETIGPCGWWNVGSPKLPSHSHALPSCCVVGSNNLDWIHIQYNRQTLVQSSIPPSTASTVLDVDLPTYPRSLA